MEDTNAAIPLNEASLPVESSAPIDYVKNVVEALLFVSEKPVTGEQLVHAVETVGLSEIKNILTLLKKEYDQAQRGITIVEIAGGYQMLTSPQYAAYVRNLYKTTHKEKLSKPALETLAIVAYKQPVTRADIELIRGVNSDGVVEKLLEKELIKVVGRKDIAGKPYLYGTTKQFLEYFGLKSLMNLPKLEEFPALQAAHQEPTSEDAVAPAEESTTDAASGFSNMEMPIEAGIPEETRSEASSDSPESMFDAQGTGAAMYSRGAIDASDNARTAQEMNSTMNEGDDGDAQKITQ